MARINFEDDIEAQEEFWALLALLGGDRDRTLGKLVRFFRIAQKAYGYDEPMTDEELRSKGFQDMIESGWAVQVEGGYQALGAAKHFKWYRQRVSAGESRAESERDENGRFKVQRSPSEPPAVDQRNAEPHQPLTLSLSPALSPVQKEYSVGAASPAQRFIGTYVKAYQARYGDKTRPSVAGKVQGQVKRFLEETPIDRACDLIQVYCQMDEPWFKTKCHDFTTFLENLNKVSLALDTGQPVGQATTDYSKIFGGAS